MTKVTIESSTNPKTDYGPDSLPLKPGRQEDPGEELTDLGISYRELDKAIRKGNKDSASQSVGGSEKSE